MSDWGGGTAHVERGVLPVDPQRVGGEILSLESNGGIVEPKLDDEMIIAEEQVARLARSNQRNRIAVLVPEGGLKPCSGAASEQKEQRQQGGQYQSAAGAQVCPQITRPV
jgi:hypothetical protein